MDWPKFITLVVLTLSSTAATADDYRLLHFGATWCGPCRTLDEQLKTKAVVAVLKARKVKILHIDLDVDPHIAEAYKVEMIPTCILVRVNFKNQATVIKRRTGLMSDQDLLWLVTPPADPPVPK